MTKSFKNFDSSSSDFLESVLNSTLYGIINFRSVRDSNDQIIDFEWQYANSIAAELAGRKKEELIGKRLLEVMPGNLESGLFEKYRAIVEDGETSTFEQFYTGEELNRWFLISAAKLEDGFTVTFQDITESKEASYRELKFRKLFNGSMDALFLMDQAGQIIESNEAFSTLFKFSTSPELMPIQSIFNKSQDFERYEHELKKLNKVEEMEVELIGKEGKNLLCIMNTIFIPSGNEQDDFFLGVIHDITKRKKAEQNLLRAEKLSMTGKIARTIAHEVRNPLTNLQLALDQLREDIPDNLEDSDLFLDIIERNANRIGTLITNLLNSSKPKELKRDSQPINPVILDALKMVKDRIKLKDISTTTTLDPSLPDLEIDAEQLKIALLNLLVNAVEAMKESEGILEVTSTLEDDQVIVQIRDNGVGIPEDQIPLLFEPFYSRKKDGTGLGMLTVQNILQGHNAVIEVKSQINDGTLFTIRFES
jgi:PAS domain S-box-containing protein